MSLFGRDLLCTQDWSVEELRQVLELAIEMKRDRFSTKWAKILDRKSFLMFFYSPSIRTHLSFEAAVTELGGQAQFLAPAMTRLKSQEFSGESIEDAAQVISRYAAGIGVRIFEDKLSYYGQGQEMLKEFAKWATVPLINMADDMFHPCQGLADIMGWAEWLGGGGIGRPDFQGLKHKKLLLTWAKGGLSRTWCSVQEALLVASRFGMNITLARPDGYDLDLLVYEHVRKNCDANSTSFEILHDPDEGYVNAHVVYSRNWVSPNAYYGGVFHKRDEIDKALRYENWITTEARMSTTDHAIFTSPMPVDRGNEVVDQVASGPRSAIYDIAENRLHVQKAILALTLGEYLS